MLQSDRAGKSTTFMYLSKNTSNSEKATQVEVKVLKKNCT